MKKLVLLFWLLSCSTVATTKVDGIYDGLIVKDEKGIYYKLHFKYNKLYEIEESNITYLW